MIKSIGKLKGKILIFGGVYSNFQALEKLIKIAEGLNIPNTNIICTGDIVAYCAEPEKCIQKIKNWNIHTIAGNVEIQLRENKNDCGCNFDDSSRCDLFSQQWYPYAQKNISISSKEYLKNIPEFISFQYGNYKGFVLHGSYHYTSEFIFKSTSWNIKNNNFIDTKSNLIVAGHCGLPFSQSKNNQHWLNAGVIGMPANDGTPRVWYLIIDLDEKGNLIYQHHSFYYDHKKANELMLQNNLPSEYAKTLITGIWDNCEILPSEETLLQGQKIKI